MNQGWKTTVRELILIWMRMTNRRRGNMMEKIRKRGKLRREMMMTTMTISDLEGRKGIDRDKNIK
jgi:hypothetical protein